jgi:hypothetical protein
MIKIIIAGLLASFLSLMSLTESRAGFLPVIVDGACCLSDGSCEDGTSLTCTADFQGADTTCSNVECPQPEPPPGPTVIVPTMGQWGMIIASVVLGFFAVLRLLRMKDLEY